MTQKHFVIVILVMLLASTAGLCQSAPGSFCDDNSYHILQRFKGETIKVNCDTAYLLNKSTFNLLYSSYTNYRSQNDSLSGFFTTADNYLYEYQKHVEEQNAEIDTMERYFRALSDSSKILVSNTTATLQNINSNLDSINSTLDSAKVKIAQAQQEIIKNEKSKWIGRVAWGLGGLVVGALIVALVK